MGIKNLNRYIKENCSKKSVLKRHLKEFTNKTLVIDTSIYLYQFIGEGSLMENMYLFISILKSYNIKPIFVFDGKPPAEKRELLRQRTEKKKEAEAKYKELSESLDGLSNEEKKALEVEMDALRRQFIRVQDQDIANVKELMDAYGVNYVNSPCEADELCVYFVKTGIADACISDDMDMFLYGCPCVLRNFSLMNHSVVWYDTKNILTELNLNEKDFRDILIISGTDYNVNMETSLIETIKWFYQYDLYRGKQQKLDKKVIGFYVWLYKNTKYIKNFVLLLDTYKAVNKSLHNNFEGYSWNIVDKPEQPTKLKEIMRKEGFIFG
jgi:flap endonuclease-1